MAKLTRQELEDTLRTGVHLYIVSQNLEGLDLSNLLLNNAQLISCNMQFVKLDGTDLTCAGLSETSLVGAKASLKPAKFHKAFLGQADLSDSDFTAADFTEADFFGNLESAPQAKLQRTRLCKALLNGSNLCRADLTEADLSNADLSNAKLDHAILERARLWCANLAGASLYRAVLSGADLTGAKFNKTRFNETIYNRYTRWPEGFNPQLCSTILE